MLNQQCEGDPCRNDIARSTLHRFYLILLLLASHYLEGSDFSFTSMNTSDFRVIECELPNPLFTMIDLDSLLYILQPLKIGISTYRPLFDGGSLLIKKQTSNTGITA